MDELGQETPIQRTVAPVSSWAGGPHRRSSPVTNRRDWLIAIGLAVIVVYAFSPCLDNEFVSWDDDLNFIENPHFRGLGPAQIKWACTTFWLGVYQPLAWLLLETEYLWSQLRPRGYHLTSLILQVVNAIVLYFLTLTLLARSQKDERLDSVWTRSFCAGLAAALFAVHPLRVEVVAWVSCQPYLPCILCSMLAVLAYLRAFPIDGAPRRGWVLGSFFLSVAALLFKAVAVSLPVVFLILDVYPLKRIPDEQGRWFGASARRAILEKVPFALLSVVFMRLAIVSKPQSRIPLQHYGVSEGIARACFGTWFYLKKTMWPLDLIAFYPSPRTVNWLAPRFGLSIVATVAISVGLILVRRRWPELLAAWLIYLVILAPNSGIVWISNQIAADRYSYMSMLSLAVVLGGGLDRLWRRHSALAIGITAILLGVLVVLTNETRKQCRTWRDTEVLWTHAVNHGGNSSVEVHNNLGVVLLTNGKNSEAKSHCALALQIKPDYSEAHNNLGNVYFSDGKYSEAEVCFAEAIKLNPELASAYTNLGNIRREQGRQQEAEDLYDKALRINPDLANAHNNMGVVLQSRGSYQKARAHLSEAIRINPNYVAAHYNLGNVLVSLGMYDDAEAHFNEALRLNRGFANAHYNMGISFYKQGKFEQAKAHFLSALEIDPAYADIHNYVAMVLLRQADYTAAEAHLSEALRLKPDFVDAHINLGTTLARQKRFKEAEAHFVQALKLDGKLVSGHFNLGRLYTDEGKFSEAAAQYAEAVKLEPSLVGAHHNLGNALSHLGKYDAAMAQYAEAIRLDPKFVEAYNASAILMSTCPDGTVRDGKKAIQLATRACELTEWKDPRFLNTLAAAEAEAGGFDSAVSWQEKAIALITVDRQKEDYRSRLALYRANKPYRQVSPAER